MTEIDVLNRTYHLMMQAFVERGHALHYVELGQALGLGPEEGRAVLHDLLATGIPAWKYDDTDYLASFAPFNNVPTQYRVSVEGRQLWFAQ